MCVMTEEILEGPRVEGVSYVRRLKMFLDGQRKDTNFLVLMLETITLPETPLAGGCRRYPLS